MPIIYDCPDCGRKVTAPDELAGKKARCPFCQSVVSVPGTQPYEAEAVPPHEPDLPHRPEGGGDPFRPRLPGGLEHAGVHRDTHEPEDAGGGDRRPCPMCGEMILVDAVKCRYCGEVFDADLRRSSSLGRRSPAQTAAFEKAVKQASGVLFAIALLNVVCGGIAVMAIKDLMPGVDPAAIIIELLVVAIIFAGLGFWARVQPYPAAIVGLVIYVGLFLLALVGAPEFALKGLVLRIVFVVLLIQAISAASKAR